jgi:hypothetical protein
LPLKKVPVNPHRLDAARIMRHSTAPRRIAVVVFAENQIRIVFEQRLDFLPSLASLRTSNGSLKNTP